jgi:hypothetical protein
MSDMECPYCEADQAASSDAHEPTRRYEHECTACGKNFTFEIEYVRHYSAHQADCSNGLPHNLMMYGTYPRRYSKMMCKHCDYERLPTAQEFAAAGIDLLGEDR